MNISKHVDYANVVVMGSIFHRKASLMKCSLSQEHSSSPGYLKLWFESTAIHNHNLFTLNNEHIYNKGSYDRSSHQAVLKLRYLGEHRGSEALLKRLLGCSDVMRVDGVSPFSPWLTSGTRHWPHWSGAQFLCRLSFSCSWPWDRPRTWS